MRLTQPVAPGRIARADIAVSGMRRVVRCTLGSMDAPHGPRRRAQLCPKAPTRRRCTCRRRRRVAFLPWCVPYAPTPLHACWCVWGVCSDAHCRAVMRSLRGARCALHAILRPVQHKVPHGVPRVHLELLVVATLACQCLGATAGRSRVASCTACVACRTPAAWSPNRRAYAQARRAAHDAE